VSKRGEGCSGWEKAFIHWDVSKTEIKTWYLLMESRLHQYLRLHPRQEYVFLTPDDKRPDEK
jgi:hypothetical protein